MPDPIPGPCDTEKAAADDLWALYLLAWEAWIELRDQEPPASAEAIEAAREVSHQAMLAWTAALEVWLECLKNNGLFPPPAP